MWTDKQKEALKAVDRWYHEYVTSRKPSKQVFYCAGYAGTGKSTLARHFAESVNNCAFGAYTGKAALVMRKNGCEGARTIHSMIYIADQNKKTGEVTWHLNRQSFLNDVDLVIIDECSMVDESLAKDLLSFRKPILVLGDPGQLPPVNGAGFFTNRTPDIMLTEIHRQAKDNPIIHLATIIRNGKLPALGQYGQSVISNKMTTSDLMNADQVLVGRNITRENFNNKIRKLKGFDPDFPVIGDKLICLQNDKDLGILNGEMFELKEILKTKNTDKSNFFNFRLISQDNEERDSFLVKVHKSFFLDDIPVPNWKVLKGTQSFNYAYAITAHKSQGSQWNNVFILDESWCFGEDRWKWLYTSVTRASEKINLVLN